MSVMTNEEVMQQFAIRSGAIRAFRALRGILDTYEDAPPEWGESVDALARLYHDAPQDVLRLFQWACAKRVENDGAAFPEQMAVIQQTMKDVVVGTAEKMGRDPLFVLALTVVTIFALANEMGHELHPTLNSLVGHVGLPHN